MVQIITVLIVFLGGLSCVESEVNDESQSAIHTTQHRIITDKDEGFQILISVICYTKKEIEWGNKLPKTKNVFLYLSMKVMRIRIIPAVEKYYKRK